MKIIFHEKVADIIKDIVEDFDNGKLEGIMIIKKVNDEIWTTFANMTYLERLGALEVLKDDFKMLANKVDRTEDD